MPVKRRRGKIRTDAMTEARAWSVAFKSGHDFLGDLRAFGLRDDDAVHAAMPDAWARLGRIHLDRNLDGPCWALEHLGEPEQCR